MSSDFGDENHSPPPKVARLEDVIVEDSTQLTNKDSIDVLPNEAVPCSNGDGPILYAALKPLLSYVSASKSMDTSQIIAQHQQSLINAAGKCQQSAYLTIPASFKILPTSGTETKLSPMLVSPLGAPVSFAKNGLYQIVPVQCQPFINTNERPATQVFKVPLLTNQKQQNLQSPSPTSVMPMMMRPPIVTVRSPSVVIPPKTIVRKSDLGLVLNQQQLNENYPEFVTPPHVLVGGSNKPPATPILFPRMTPETPSSTMDLSVLNTVTRKLMSLHGEENI